jgi:plasmid stabilization system protein ParE
MANRIEWNKRAIEDLYTIVSYFVQKGAIQSAAAFNQKVRDKIDKLANNRTVGRKASAAKTILFVLVGKNHKLYYRKIGLTIRIVCFFDTRQDPDKSPY